MASIAYYHRILKEDFSRRRQIFAGLLPVQTLLEAAQATGPSTERVRVSGSQSGGDVLLGDRRGARRRYRKISQQ